MGQPRLLFRLFSSFQTLIKFLQQINVKNSQPSDYESPALTTGPGLNEIVITGKVCFVFTSDFNSHFVLLSDWKLRIQLIFDKTFWWNSPHGTHKSLATTHPHKYRITLRLYPYQIKPRFGLAMVSVLVSS